MRLTALLIGLTLAFFCLLTIDAYAQVEVPQPQVEYQFAQQIEISAQVSSTVTVTQATLFYIPAGVSETASLSMTVSAPGDLYVTIDVVNNPVRVFSEITYWIEGTLQDGGTFTSPHYSFLYEDNRFEWSEKSAAPFRVHWFKGDPQFAQSVLDVAKNGLVNIHDLIQAGDPTSIDIYAYASALQMRDALQSTQNSWIGAHTDPDLRTMLVSLPVGPEQRLEAERQIPHELMHIMLYQKTGKGYAKLPLWLNEGLASVAELYPNPDYFTVLEEARQQGSLLQISTLCDTFPRFSSGLYLAYAESNSFVRYILQKNGKPGLESLVEIYAQGAQCELGFNQALGVSLAEFEHEWRSEVLGEDQVLSAVSNLLPWLAILALALLVPLALIFTAGRRKPGGQATKP